MTIATMRGVDRFIGVPICLLTGWWNTIAHRRTPRKDFETILVIKFFGIGSVLLTTPFLSMLRRSLPNAHIVYLTFEGNAELLARLPQPHETLTISTASPWRFLMDTWRIVRELRKLTIDIVFDLEFFAKFSTLLSTLSGAPMRVGYALPTRWRASNLTHPITLDNSEHVVRGFLGQLRALGKQEITESPVTSLKASESERTSMQGALGLGSNGTELIVMNMNAGATSPERRWMPERFMEIARLMLKANRAPRFFFIGSKEERSYVAQAIAGNPEITSHVVNCAGLLSLGELIALLERASLIVTNDSGPMHIASAVGTPMVALFGPETPQFYGPYGGATTIYKAISCSPCLNIYDAKAFVCPYNARCMREISVDEVLAAMNDILEPARAGIA